MVPYGVFGMTFHQCHHCESSQSMSKTLATLDSFPPSQFPWLTEQGLPKMSTSWSPRAVTMGIYPKERKTGYSTDTCTPMFIAALSTIAKLCKPSALQLMDGSWNCDTQWSITQPQGNDMWFEGKWMQLEEIMLSEVSQAQKKKATCFLSLRR
jgi:hypothetical protein